MPAAQHSTLNTLQGDDTESVQGRKMVSEECIPVIRKHTQTHIHTHTHTKKNVIKQYLWLNIMMVMIWCFGVSTEACAWRWWWWWRCVSLKQAAPARLSVHTLSDPPMATTYAVTVSICCVFYIGRGSWPREERFFQGTLILCSRAGVRVVLHSEFWVKEVHCSFVRSFLPLPCFSLTNISIPNGSYINNTLSLSFPQQDIPGTVQLSQNVTRSAQ